MTNSKPKTFFKPRRMVVESGMEETAMVQRLRTTFPGIQIDHTDDANQFISQAHDQDPDQWGNTLLLARQRGPFLRLCPGTQKHICCLYYNLDVAAGCDLGCSYCILQGYLDTPLVTVYANHDDMYRELDHALLDHPTRFYRIGTGELSDSLTFDPFLGLGADLVNYFADKKNAIIELKSKNIHIDDLLGLKHNGRAVISWSMNAETVSRQDEGIAPSLEDRLKAAQQVQAAGYRIGFHFDPMIRFEGWREEYGETIERIFRVIKPENIAWISLGALRYPAMLDDIIRENHPESPIVLGELLPGRDKKMRYFLPQRIEMFSFMFERIKQFSDNVFVYLCMENKYVWERSFNWAPKNSAHLKSLLDSRVT